VGSSDKKDSQGLCFIGKVKLPDFLQQQLRPKQGDIIEIANDNEIYQEAHPDFDTDEERLAFLSKPLKYEENMGKKVGEHRGAHYFTIGQRKGLQVGGTPEPLFVIDTDVKTNIIYTGQSNQHPGLFRKVLRINPNEIHWIREDKSLSVGEKLEVMTRIRYRQPLQKAVLHQYESGLYAEFENAQSAITPGQFAAFYINDELIGSGVISE